ncbi:uncharacterized protein NECHADRAFT_77064 [Fusarium vanettenii 77-13-4]|uniref:mitogen-activated protein kinase n=1 Tax=Fusarium vanettenii (strain ATCC MYA-4622 / CBS 123669 / FGSC 9596 / NRRL 45880 / 77-13-4) TaxID=660122 RepID=C7ZCI5_FUSV7|nr:uncharacterized protein NECHADRAFT_77064 [Fusarium vanettenii 77-13-4]EEU38268.1 hypothetical protein NECHADRAFT_77064 [Fusarium vanettenii 77-13-4]
MPPRIKTFGPLDHVAQGVCISATRHFDFFTQKVRVSSNQISSLAQWQRDKSRGVQPIHAKYNLQVGHKTQQQDCLTYAPSTRESGSVSSYEADPNVLGTELAPCGEFGTVPISMSASRAHSSIGLSCFHVISDKPSPQALSQMPLLCHLYLRISITGEVRCGMKRWNGREASRTQSSWSSTSASLSCSVSVDCVSSRVREKASPSPSYSYLGSTESGSAELKLVPLDALNYPALHDSLTGEQIISIPPPDDVVEPDLFFLYLVVELFLWTRAEAVGLQLLYGFLAGARSYRRGILGVARVPLSRPTSLQPVPLKCSTKSSPVALTTAMPHKHKARIPISIRPRVKQPKINYEIIHPSIGSGAFGKVYKARNLDNGAMMAVKVVSIIDDGRDIKMLRNEVEILARSNHRHIIELITSEGWSGHDIKIFMTLKEGSLTSLALATSNAKLHDIAETALHHMLQALDYLASQNILHRDVKPDNILYSMVRGKPHFELGDFGLAIEARHYEDQAGTFCYMAPDVLLRGAAQTAKSDVWSLYATMLWVLDGRGFREKCRRLRDNGGPQQLFSDITDMTQPVPQELSHIEEMAAFNACCRASAGEMLDKLFPRHGNRNPNVNPPRQERVRRERGGGRREMERPRERTPGPRAFNVDDLVRAFDINLEEQQRGFD